VEVATQTEEEVSVVPEKSDVATQVVATTISPCTHEQVSPPVEVTPTNLGEAFNFLVSLGDDELVSLTANEDFGAQAMQLEDVAQDIMF